MDQITLILLSISLAMDAFAVAICKGLAINKPTIKQIIWVGLWFGLFQALMPVIGYFLGNAFVNLITKIDHWVAFILLGFIGVSMIKESRNTQDSCNPDLGIKTMFIMALATSIDALAVGVTLAFLETNIWLAAGEIGIITFALSCIGVRAGSHLGSKYGSTAELVGGIILILLGTKILLEHLNII